MRLKISVLAKTNSRVEGVEQVDATTFIVRVRVPPEDGKANDRICELLAEYFSRPKSRVEIVSGHKSKKKIVEVG